MITSQIKQSGFTLIELIVVILLSSILAAFAIPRFIDQDSFNQRGFLEESRSVIRAAQKIAISSGCHMRVTFNAGTPGSYVIQRWLFCRPTVSTHLTLVSQNLVGADGDAITGVSPNNIQVTALDFYFDQIGRPRRLSDSVLLTNASDLELTISDTVNSSTIQIVPLTGYLQ